MQLQCGHGGEAVENVVSAIARRNGRSMTLQCGHGGEAVENLATSDAAVKRSTLLQCGHGGEAVENADVHAAASVVRHGFNAATAVRPWRTG